MTQFEKIKQEISAMSLDEFFKHFISGKGIREYICGDIKVPHALCKNADYDCLECIKDYLKGEVAE
jgi:hypothetical protein